MFLKEEKMSNSKQLHVSKNKEGEEGWKVTHNGVTLSTYPTQKEGKDDAVSKAKQIGGEVVVHGLDGRIRSKDSYGNDPFPPRDWEH